MTAYRVRAEVEVLVHEAEDKQRAAEVVKRKAEACLGGAAGGGTLIEDVRASVKAGDVREDES